MCTGKTNDGTLAEGPSRGGISKEELSKGGAPMKDKPSEESKPSEGTGKTALSG